VTARIPPIAESEFILGPAQTLRLNTDIDSILKSGVEGKNYHSLFGILYPKTVCVAAQEVGSTTATMSGGSSFTPMDARKRLTDSRLTMRPLNSMNTVSS
jgi:hypothetical protein